MTESTGSSSASGAAQPRPSSLETRRAWGFRARGLIGGLVLFPAAAIALFSAPPAAEGSWADLALRLAGWATFLAALLMRLWSTLYLGGYKEGSLITDGPYAMCRNPLYVGSFLIALSIGIFLGSPLFIAGIVVTAVCYLTLTVPAEEALLQSIHGEAFKRYLATTPRVFPRPSLFRSEPTKVIHVGALRTEARRMRLWIFLPLLGELSLHLRAQPWWPHLHLFH